MALPDPYIHKDPNDLIRSVDWNDIQSHARQELRVHMHRGGDDGAQIPREGIAPRAIDGSLIDPSATVGLAKLNVSSSLKVLGRELLTDINNLLTRATALEARATTLEGGKVNRAGDTISGPLTVQGQVVVMGPVQAHQAYFAGSLGVARGITVGAGGDAILMTRHVYGKTAGADNPDALYLNWGNSKPVVIGKPDAASPLEIYGPARIYGDRLRNSSGYSIVQTDATDWLRINPEQEFPAIAMHKPVAIGTGGLAVGEWSQQPAGHIKATGAVIAGGLEINGAATITRFVTAGGLAINGTATIAGPVIAGGLMLNGAAKITKSVTAGGLMLNGAAKIIGSVTTGGLGVNGAAKITGALNVGEWTLEPSGSSLFIKCGGYTIARISTDRDRLQVYRNRNGAAPYFYFNEDGNYGVHG